MTLDVVAAIVASEANNKSSSGFMAVRSRKKRKLDENAGNEWSKAIFDCKKKTEEGGGQGGGI